MTIRCRVSLNLNGKCRPSVVNENKGTTLGHNCTMYMLVPISAFYSSFLLALLSPLSVSIFPSFTHTAALGYD